MSDLIIRKGHPIIEAGYKLSLAEQRIILLSLAKLDSRDVLQRKVTLSAIDFAKTFGVSEKVAYRDLLTASKKLYDGSIILKGEDETTEFRWIESRTRYHKGEGRISFEFSSKVMPYLFELDKQLGYTQYHLLSVSGFSGTYSIRLYELCKKLQGMKNTEVEIEEIRRMLMLGDKYKEFKVLKRRVLTPSIAEINEKSDLLVSVEFIKSGRSVKGLKFTISSKKPANSTIIDTKCTHLTKDGLTNLSLALDRTQFKQAGEYEKACIKIRKADVERLENEGRTVPDKAYEQLGKWYRVIGDKDLARKYEKLAGKDKPSKPQKAVEPDRFSYLLDTLKAKDHTRETAKELLELSRVDGVNQAHKNLAEGKYKQIMERLDAEIEQEVCVRPYGDEPVGFDEFVKTFREDDIPKSEMDEEEVEKALEILEKEKEKEYARIDSIIAEIEKKKEELDLLLGRVLKEKNKTA